MALVLIESPKKEPKLRKILGKDYKIMATVGHIMDLPPNELGIDLDTFQATYQVYPEKKDIVKAIREEAKHHDVIYIATDPDREGSAIGYHVKSILPKNKKIFRLKFNEISKVAVMKSLDCAESMDVDADQYQAQQARRITDRIVGFKVSPVMWNKGLAKTSAGRVQSVALKYVAEREKEIRAFIPEEYWEIKVQLDNGLSVDLYGINGKKYLPATKEEAEAIVKDILKSKIVSVTEYESKTRNRKPYPPFITSSMQQAANAQFGWSAQRTMQVANDLFGSGQISYPRTDSTRVAEEKISEIRKTILTEYGKKYLSQEARIYNAKDGAQDAHEAIRPTLDGDAPTDGKNDDDKLLDLITRRFMASQMAEAIFDTASAELTCKGKETYNFKVKGSILKFDGFLKVYGDSKQDEILPSLEEGQKFKITKVVPSQHSTRPPGRYSDASLIEKLEKEGVGRPSTFATIIETLINRSYSERDAKVIRATDIGIMVSDYLSAFFEELVEPAFTAQMEENLDKIADGKLKGIDVLTAFYQKLQEQIKSAQKGDAKKIFTTDIKCKSCKDENMVKRTAAGEVFLGCSNYPTCGFTFNIDVDGSLTPSKVPTGEPCPDCGSILVERKGPHGSFLGCSGFSSGCKYTIQLDEDGNKVEKKKTESTNIKCEKCKKGELVKRYNKDGKPFLACNKYPDCKTIVSIKDDGSLVAQSTTKKTGKKCPKCKEGSIVERKSSWGSFKGCSAFPNCKFIQK